MTALRSGQIVGLSALQDATRLLDDLYAATDMPVTARTRWQEIWSRTHPGWEPWVVTLTDGKGRLAGAAPFARARRGPLVRVVGLGHGTADDARFPLREPEHAASLARAAQAALAEIRRPWALLVEQVPADCPVTDALIGVLPHARLQAGQGMPMMVVGSDRQPNHYLSRNARNAENKARNRLREAGHDVRERWLTDAAEVRAAVPRLSAVHRARDEALGRVSDHDDPDRASFYSSVLTQHAAAGELELLLLEIDGQLAAYVAAFRDGQALRVWDNRLSPDWADFSAGRLANHTAIRRVLDDPGLSVLDWMRGEEPYKLSSATVIVPTRTLQAWSSPAARAPYAGKDVLRLLRDRVPALDRGLRRARINLGKSVSRLTGNRE